ncbi:MAG TPA: hypothetical protein VM100_08640 [Longimicrobiales bacterium]|nr:hypothetical protein [Longimicrobiales bacterium]
MTPVHCKEAAESLLRQLPSVLGAFVREDINGHPREIHLLVSPGPNVKLLAQDVRELLEERLEIPIDHRVISIAQLAEDIDFGENGAEIEDSGRGERRVRFLGTVSEVREQKVRVRTQLSAGGVSIEGEATELDVGAGRMRAATLATLRAAGQATGQAAGQELRLEVESVSIVRAFDREYVLVAVMVGGGPFGRKLLHLAGAQPVEHDVETAAALATLKAVNRLLAKLLLA